MSFRQFLLTLRARWITVALTLSHATHFGGSIGNLKCYDVAGGKEKAC